MTEGVGQSWVYGGMGQVGGPMRVELQGRLTVVRVEREVRVERDRGERSELSGRRLKKKKTMK